MMGYGRRQPAGQAADDARPHRAPAHPQQFLKLAEYLATVNLSASDKWSYQLKTLPRPSGDSTQVIVTEYDLAAGDHRAARRPPDKDGNVWYTDFGEQFLAKFDPKTLKLTQYPVKQFKANAPAGLLSIAFDKEDCSGST